MADKTFASLVSRLAPSVPGCPQPTITQYIRDAAIRVCERTLYWRYQIPLFNLVPGVHEYFYNKPVTTEVHAVFSALVNDSPLEKLTLDRALEFYPQWADLFGGQSPASVWAQVSGSTFNNPEFNEVQFNQNGSVALPDFEGASTPQSICQITPDKYIVLPLPDDAHVYQMRMFVALKPRRDSSGMDEFILDELEEVIMHGALQHLLVLPNAHWSDRELAVYHAKQFAYQVAERRARANLGNVRGMMRARMQPFGA
jgi:hypothetical protein